MKYTQGRQYQRGFSLTEVLIALLVLMFGVLGMVGLQAMAVSNAVAGQYNGQAAIEASSIAAAMKANAEYWGSLPGTVTVTPGTTPGSIAISGGPAAFSGSCVSGTTCTAAQMAYYDLTTVGTDIASNLPGGTLGISCVLNGAVCASPALFTLTITWFEKNIALHNGTGAETGVLATGTAKSHQYQTMVSVL